MSFLKGTRPNRMQKASKRVLIGETRGKRPRGWNERSPLIR